MVRRAALSRAAARFAGTATARRRSHSPDGEDAPIRPREVGWTASGAKTTIRRQRAESTPRRRTRERRALMPEGLNPIEAGKKLHEHGEAAHEQAAEEDGHKKSSGRHSRIVQIGEAILL